MANQKQDPEKTERTDETVDANEGEGNRTAARRYDEGVAETIASGKVDEAAEEAAKALDGAEGEELREAEKKGKKRAA
ncbi:MAG: hypothetical protein QM820_02735 [Minicystis sp.]